MKLVVFGGSGFLGQRVCQEAVKRGWNVSSVSRNIPHHLMETSLWGRRVNWIRGNVLEGSFMDSLPSSGHLNDCDAIVYCLGSLFDRVDYKKFLNDARGVQVEDKAATGGGGGGGGDSMLEKLNYKGALDVANAAVKAKNISNTIASSSSSSSSSLPFVYISADPRAFPMNFITQFTNPFLKGDGESSKYLATKLHAERDLISLASSVIKPIIIRPGR